MSYKVFYSDISKQALKPLYVLYGPEKLMIDRMLDALKENCLAPSVCDFNYIVNEDPSVDFDMAMGLIERVPVMDKRRIVVFKGSEFLTDGRWSQQEIDRFLLYHEKNDSQVTIILLSTIDKRKRVYKYIDKVGTLICFDKLNASELIKWMVREVEKLGKQIDRTTCAQFIEKLGYHNKDSDLDLYGILNMIQRVAHKTSRKKIVVQDLSDLVDKSTESNIFKMIDATFEGRSKEAYTQLNALLAHDESPIKIIFMLQRHIRQLLKIKLLHSHGFSASSIAEQLALKLFIVKKSLLQLSKLSLPCLYDLLRRAELCDLQIKSSVEARTTVESLMANILAK